MNQDQSSWMSCLPTCVVVGCLVIVLLPTPHVAAQKNRSESSSPERIKPASTFGFELPTLGGTWYWSDVRTSGGWKIQRNAVKNHFRLIDSRSVCRASGELAECERALQQNLANGELTPTTGKVVILLHGLLRSNDSMSKLGQYLREQGGYEVINLTYASSMGSVEQHASDLQSVISGLDPQITEINFVAHSLGNIVVRHYLKSCGAHRDPRFHRMVMLAPPNQGSEKARKLSQNTQLFAKLAGPSGQQLGVQWPELAPQLATPWFEFGIIIGAKQEKSPSASARTLEERIPESTQWAERLADLPQWEPHDFTVSVDEARLAGARDFIVGPYYHWDVKHHPTAMRQTLHFLKQGQFEHSSTNESEQDSSASKPPRR